METKKTMRSVIWNKIILILEKYTFLELFKFLATFLFSILLTMLITFPATTYVIIKGIALYKNAMLTKFIFVYIGLSNVNKIKKTVYNFLPKTEYVENDQLEGIPTIELLDHLFEQKSFKRSEVENKFNIPRNRYQLLAEKFESLGVLVRGDNNSRVLNPDFSRQDIVSMINGVSRADEIKKPFTRKDNYYSFMPTNKKIQDRTASPLVSKSNENLFNMRKIA